MIYAKYEGDDDDDDEKGQNGNNEGDNDDDGRGEHQWSLRDGLHGYGDGVSLRNISLKDADDDYSMHGVKDGVKDGGKDGVKDGVKDGHRTRAETDLT